MSGPLCAPVHPSLYLDIPDIPREGRRGPIYHQLHSTNSKAKRRFTVSVLGIIVKKANNRLLTHIVVRAYGHIAVEHTCALRPSRTGRHPPPRPALQLTHAERTFRSVHAAYAEILPDVRRARVLSTRVRMVFSITTSHANCGQLLYPQT